MRMEGEYAFSMSFFLPRLPFPVVDDLERVVDVFHVASSIDPINDLLIPGNSELSKTDDNNGKDQ